MKIKDIMTREVISVEPRTPVTKVAELIFTNRFHGLPVVEKEKLVGIITEDDFFLKDSELFLPDYIKFLKKHRPTAKIPEDMRYKMKKLLNTKAKDIMTEKCLTVFRETDALDLMKLIRKTRFTTYPVVDNNNNLVGIVTLSDILGMVKETSSALIQSLGGADRKKDINLLAGQLNEAWHSKFMVVSRRSVKTWKGMLAIGLTALLVCGIVIAYLLEDYAPCESSDQKYLPTTCQKFKYSDWSPCLYNGTQSRTVLERLPKGCQGGAPVLDQPCTK